MQIKIVSQEVPLYYADSVCAIYSCAYNQAIW